MIVVKTGKELDKLWNELMQKSRCNLVEKILIYTHEVYIIE